MIYSWVKRTSRRPAGLSVRYHGRWVFIRRLCPRLFVSTCVWNVSRGAVHKSWQTRFCFRSSRSMPLTLFSFRTKRCSRSLHLTIRLQELLKKKLSIFFSADTARSAAAWPPVNSACLVGSEMCIRDRFKKLLGHRHSEQAARQRQTTQCLHWRKC